MITGACHCGAVGWTFEGLPEAVTACNCTLCRRYGVLWAYDYEGERIRITGATAVYLRKDMKPEIEIHFCRDCGCVVCWRALDAEQDGRRRIAVNVRLTDPEPIAHLPINHFEGLVSFKDLPRDGRCVSDMWF